MSREPFFGLKITMPRYAVFATHAIADRTLSWARARTPAHVAPTAPNPSLWPSAVVATLLHQPLDHLPVTARIETALALFVIEQAAGIRPFGLRLGLHRLDRQHGEQEEPDEDHAPHWAAAASA